MNYFGAIVKNRLLFYDEGRYDEFLPRARIDYLKPENFNPGKWKRVTFDFQAIGR